MESFGYRNELEESERPEGPYITEFDTLTEVHDFAGNRYRNVTDGVVYPVFKSSSGSVADGDVVMRVSGTTQSTGTPQQLEVIREREALSPERLLVTALDSPDAHTEPDTVLQSVPQNVVAFALDGAPVRIYLNAFTHLAYGSRLLRPSGTQRLLEVLHVCIAKKLIAHDDAVFEYGLSDPMGVSVLHIYRILSVQNCFCRLL